jgi:hypothetical protein
LPQVPGRAAVQAEQQGGVVNDHVQQTGVCGYAVDRYPQSMGKKGKVGQCENRENREPGRPRPIANITTYQSWSSKGSCLDQISQSTIPKL